MELERRERHARIKDSRDAAENTVAGNSESVTSSSENPGQIDRILHWADDSGTDRILDSPLHIRKPGERDPPLPLSDGVHWNPGSAPGRRALNLEDQWRNPISLEAKTTISAVAEMVVFCYPETLQFRQIRVDGISGPLEKYRRFRVRKMPKITPN